MTPLPPAPGVDERIAEIEGRHTDVEKRNARVGWCSGGSLLREEPCKKCGARKDQNCPQDIKDGEQAQLDRSWLLTQLRAAQQQAAAAIEALEPFAKAAAEYDGEGHRCVLKHKPGLVAPAHIMVSDLRRAAALTEQEKPQDDD